MSYPYFSVAGLCLGYVVLRSVLKMKPTPTSAVCATIGMIALIAGLLSLVW